MKILLIAIELCGMAITNGISQPREYVDRRTEKFGIDDLTRRAGKLAASNYDPLRMISIAMIMYVVVLFVLSRASRVVDQHLQRRMEVGSWKAKILKFSSRNPQLNGHASF